jgi:hypothetical protein
VPELLLELYQGRLPGAFRELPGATNLPPEPHGADIFWAVVIQAPSLGSPAAVFLAPSPPDPSGGPVSATTHGTDTLPFGVSTFVVQQACIWRPKTPPYRFEVITPWGEAIVLDPPGLSIDEFAWHCESVARPTNAIGVWIIRVVRKDAANFPQRFGGRNACLNPEFLTFGAAAFQRQPLLRLLDDRVRENPDPERCPFDVTVVVHPGACNRSNTKREMTFDVTVTPPGVIDYKWLYGDPDHTQLEGTSPASGSFSIPPSGSFSYPAGDTYVATLFLLSPASCVGDSIQVDVEVEACGPDECPVSRVELVVEDANGTNVTTQLQEDGCLPTGQYVVSAVVEPPGATSDFSWSVGGVAAAVPQRGVVAINGRQLTIDLTLFRSVSVIAAGCASDGIDLRPCGGTTCPTVVWTSNVSPNCNADYTRDTTLAAIVSSFGAPITVELRNPQGTVLDSATTPANGTVSLDSGSPLRMAPGNHQFSVVFTNGLPRGCAVDDTEVVIVPDCDDGNEGTESPSCAILRVIGLTLLIVGLVGAIAGACTGNVGVWVGGSVVALVGAGLLVLWAWLCAPGAGCLTLQHLIGLVNLLIAFCAVMLLILAVVAIILALFGIPPLHLGCLGSLLTNAGILGILTLILYQFFYSQGCQWQGTSVFR